MCFVCVMCGVATVPVFCVCDVWGGYAGQEETPQLYSRRLKTEFTRQ